MTIVNTGSVDLGYILEVTPGTTPATPTFQLIPTVSGSPDGNIDTKSSEEIRTDRMDLDLTVVDRNIAGKMDYELTYTPYAPLLTALMGGTAVTLNETQADIAAAASGKTFTSAALADFSAVGAGDFILVSGFTGDTSNNGIFKVASASTLVITLDSSETLVDDAAGESVTITANRIANSVSVATVHNSYTFLKRVQQITSPAYMYYRGCMINGINWDFSVGDFVKGNFDIIGLSEDITETAITSSSYTAVAAHVLMSSANAATIASAGLGAGIDIEKATIQYDNHIEAAKAVGTEGAVSLKPMTMECIVELTMYFEDIAAYTLLAASTSFELTFTLVDGDENYIVLHLPECKFQNLESPVPGKDQFFFLNGTVKAFKDATLGYAAAMNLLAAH
mgnify:CR=1 FL=1